MQSPPPPPPPPSPNPHALGEEKPAEVASGPLLTASENIGDGGGSALAADQPSAIREYIFEHYVPGPSGPVPVAGSLTAGAGGSGADKPQKTARKRVRAKYTPPNPLPEGQQGCSGCRITHPKNWFTHPSNTSCKARRPLTHEEIAKAQAKKLKALQKKANALAPAHQSLDQPIQNDQVQSELPEDMKDEDEQLVDDLNKDELMTDTM